MDESSTAQRLRERALAYRRASPELAHWAAGYGVIEHNDLTQVRIYELANWLSHERRGYTPAQVYAQLAAADRVASAAMWLVAHMTYAERVRLDGEELLAEELKRRPEGHTGGALNMVPAYVGYLAANVLACFTRGWLMGQGHCVAAIDAANVLVGNTTPAHARYTLDDAGLSRLVHDYYSYAVDESGRPASPLGSHVNPNTAGALIEGGYLGFAELQYVHMPLPGERLVAFLSDGAFEEQRGSDWAPRFWRAEDSGLVTPVMIANGRRIDQRTTLSQEGGVAWLRDHLRQNHFDPIDIDGRDPAAFAWAIFEAEERLQASAKAIECGEATYPVRLPYVIAETIKGYGFPGAGTNAAHNLPLGKNPHDDETARAHFRDGTRALWVPQHELTLAVMALQNHDAPPRPRERDHALARRAIGPLRFPSPAWLPVGESVAPMQAVDHGFAELVRHNPELRPRVGNPDEMDSNRMHETLRLLKHRVTAPEGGVPESTAGGVITALNEEAVVCAALGNKGGLNLVVSYEAFAVKMLGALRQEIIFSRHQRQAGRPAGWLSVPVVLSSHVWENGKNEQSHQDPALVEVLLHEMTDVSRVLFVADHNSALAALHVLFSTRGQIWTMVVAKNVLPNRFSAAEAQQLATDGALMVRGSGEEPVQLVAVGAYQLTEALGASDLLRGKGIAHSLVYLQDPGRFREPRDRDEAAVMAPRRLCERLFSGEVRARVILAHTRPGPLLGVLRPLDLGTARTRCLGFINQGGTLDVQGMLRANRCTAADVVAAVEELVASDRARRAAGRREARPS
jgi:phosphoketolase